MTYDQINCTRLDEMRDRFNSINGVIVLDTETTGLGTHDYKLRHKNYVLQLSIISAHSGRVLYNGFFRPFTRSWDDAEQIHHISPNDVKDKPRFAKEREKIQSIIDNAQVIIGYNTSFDISFLESEGIRFDKTKYEIDVMRDYASFYGEMHEYFHTYTWQSLSKAAQRTHYDWSKHEDAHNSLGDCYATLHVANFLQTENIERGWKPYYPFWYGIEGDFDPEEMGEQE